MPNLNTLFIDSLCNKACSSYPLFFLEQTNIYLKVKIFTCRSQELPLKKQTPEKKMALTGCPKSYSTMALINCNFQSKH